MNGFTKRLNYALFATSIPLKSKSAVTVVTGGKIASILQMEIITPTDPGIAASLTTSQLTDETVPT